MHSLEEVRAYLEEAGVIKSEEDWDEREQFIFDAMVKVNFPFNEFCEKIKRVILAENDFLAEIKKQKKPENPNNPEKK